MKRIKIVTFALGTALLSAFLFFGTAAVAPEEACAGQCQFDWWTRYQWTSASTCSQASSACYNQARAAAIAECENANKSLCQVGSYWQSSCNPFGSQVQMDCYLQFKCGAGLDF